MKQDKINLMMVFSSLFDGLGICHNVFNYCKYLDREKFNIQFVMINEPTPYFKKILEKTGDKYYVLSMRNTKRLKYIRELCKILKREKIDIIHAHGNSATLALEMVAGKMAGIPVRIAHSRNSTCQHKKADKILRPLFYLTYTDAFAVSKEAGDWLFKSKPYTIIKNGNDIERFKYNEISRKKWRKKLNLNGDEIAIGHVGTFNKRKNQTFAVDVFNELIKKNNNYVMFFVGEGDLKKGIEEKVKKMGLEKKVKFLGLIDDMQDFIQAMDAMILTSFFEGLPNVAIEWQAASLPCIISDSITKEAKLTNLPKYISLDSGAKEWANAIDSIDFVDRSKCNEKDIDKIRKAGFDVKTNAKSLEKKYIELIHLHRGE